MWYIIYAKNKNATCRNNLNITLEYIGDRAMKQKKLTLVVVAIMLFSFVAASPAHAIIGTTTLAVIGFSALIVLIVGDKTIKKNNDSVAKQIAPEQKTEGKLQAASDIME